MGQKNITGKTVKYYSTKSYLEIALDFGYQVSSNSDASAIVYQNLPDLYSDLQEYSDLNSYYTEFRTGKQFKCTSVVYSEKNARITEMYYEEI